MDRSRPRYVFQPGVLWSGINGHLTRGGDFEKRKSFVSKYSLPANTKGFAKTVDTLYVFGAQATPNGFRPASPTCGSRIPRQRAR